MTVEIVPGVGKWQAEHERIQSDTRAGGLRETRAAAFARFAELGFPTTEHESWRLTNVAPIAKQEWQAAGEGVAEESALAPLRLPEASVELVFINGRLDRTHSRGAATAGVRVESLAAALPSADGDLSSFTRIADWEDRSFVALNTALAADGAVVLVADGVRAGVIHAIFYTSAGEADAQVSTRVLLRTGRSSEVSFVETHAGEGRYFSNVVTEIDGGEGSTIDHTKVVAESGEAYHVGAVEVRQGRSSTVRTSLLGLDGLLVRNEVSTTMAGEGASCVLDGLYVLGGRQHFDANTRIIHDSPHTDSVELYKGVLDQAARGVFNGLIVVRPDAQKITAHQTSKNLLLSNEAIADSNPQLEIHADDVKCAHGSTIGQLDETSLFYLRSRGIGLDQARGILTLAFAGEVVDRIRIESLRDRLRASLLDRLAPAAPKELS